MNDVDGPDVIAALLRQRQVGTDPKDTNAKWPIFIDNLSDDPEDAIGVFNNSIPTQGRIHRTGQTISQHGIQVRIRAKLNTEAKIKILEVQALFDKILNEPVTVEDKRYLVLSINQTVTLMPMGLDKNDRQNYSLNYKASITRI